jgi:hypothetical protein
VATPTADRWLPTADRRPPTSRLGLAREIQRHRSADERLKRLLVDLIALADIDGTPHIAVEAGVEQTRRVLQPGSLGERHLDDALVGFSGADNAGVGPDGGSHPLPLFDDFGIRLVDDAAQFGEHLPAPVVQVLDPSVDQCRGRLNRGWLLHVQLQRIQPVGFRRVGQNRLCPDLLTCRPADPPTSQLHSA